jgi:hypothetical protein
VLLAMMMPPAPAKTIYVDTDAAGANDGSRWANAYNYLQDALADANSSSKPVEVRVAQGLYRPDRSAAQPEGTGDREAAFGLMSGVALKGGYAGAGEADPNARDIGLCETILSADLYGNDGPDFANYSDNSYHVITAAPNIAEPVLDGFTITSGNASLWDTHACGAAIFIESAATTVLNCTLRDNYAISGGALSPWLKLRRKYLTRIVPERKGNYMVKEQRRSLDPVLSPKNDNSVGSRVWRRALHVCASCFSCSNALKRIFFCSYYGLRLDKR